MKERPNHSWFPSFLSKGAISLLAMLHKRFPFWKHIKEAYRFYATSFLSGWVLIIIFGNFLHAQDLRLPYPALNQLPTQLSFEQLSLPFFNAEISFPSGLASADPHPLDKMTSSYFLPTYARENPAGHAPLCRLELAIENQWPIGIWAEADAAAQLRLGLMPQPLVQVKLLRF